MTTRRTSAGEWISLADQGFPKYEVSAAGQVRRVGSTRVRASNKNGAVGLTDARGRKRCVLVGKLCRLAHGPDAPGASAEQTKLTPMQVRTIRVSTRVAPTVLAARLGVSPSTVKAARAGITHADVPTETRAHYMTDGEAMRGKRAA